jgi:hypothetical protein
MTGFAPAGWVHDVTLTLLFVTGTVVADMVVLQYADNFFFLSAHGVPPWVAPVWISLPRMVFYLAAGGFLGVFARHVGLSVAAYLVAVLLYYGIFRFGEFWVAPGLLPIMILFMPYAVVPLATVAGALAGRALARETQAPG